MHSFRGPSGSSYVSECNITESNVKLILLAFVNIDMCDDQFSSKTQVLSIFNIFEYASLVHF